VSFGTRNGPAVQLVLGAVSVTDPELGVADWAGVAMATAVPAVSKAAATTVVIRRDW
jgi:hypothetical protein